MTERVRQSLFTTWQCPRCNWYRDLSLIPEQQRKIIDHPIYGEVSNYTSYLMDIKRHSCRETRLARERYGIPDVKRVQPYTRRIERRNAA